MQRDGRRFILHSGGDLLECVDLLLHGATKWLRKRALERVDIHAAALLADDQNLRAQSATQQYRVRGNEADAREARGVIGSDGRARGGAGVRTGEA